MSTINLRETSIIRSQGSVLIERVPNEEGVHYRVTGAGHVWNVDSWDSADRIADFASALERKGRTFEQARG